MRSSKHHEGSNIDHVMKLWGEGKSASQICALTKCVSRNAVIGLIHRHLPKYPDVAAKRPVKRSDKFIFARRTSDPESLKRGTIIQKSGNRKVALTLPSVEVKTPFEKFTPKIPTNAKFGPVTIVDLEAHHCRWIEGDVDEDRTVYCGQQIKDGFHYCEQHAMRAVDRTVSRRPGAWK